MNREDISKYCQLGKVQELQNLLSSSKIDKQSLFKAITACMEAKEFLREHQDIISLVLQQGLDINYRISGQSLIMIACKKNRLEIVKFLVSLGANPKDTDSNFHTNIIYALDSTGKDPIDLVKYLHEKEADIHRPDHSRWSPLHYAAHYGHHLSLEYLIRQKVNPNCQDTDLNTPLHVAFRSDKTYCVEILLPVTNKNLKNSQGKTPLEEAHSKSLAKLNLNKHQADDWHETRRGRWSKPKGRGYVKRGEKEASECSSCKRVTEVFCRECAKFYIEKPENDRNLIKELEENLKVLQGKIKEIDKENFDLKEIISKSAGLKKRLSPLYLKTFKDNRKEHIYHCLQNDIVSFAREQEKFLENIHQTYQEVVEMFKQIISSSVEGGSVEVFGSLSTGLLLPYSDIDLVITGCQSSPASVLKELIRKIETNEYVKKTQMILTANIPVIKIHMLYKTEIVKNDVIRIDLTVQENKHKGVECMNLVKKILTSFNTLKQVYLVVKQLMYFCNFHEPYTGGISSYGLFLMDKSIDRRFVSLDREGNFSNILVQFLDFYINQFDYQKLIVIDYESWDNRELKNRSIQKSLRVPDPLNPNNNVVHNTNLDTFITILYTAYLYIFRLSMCECQDCSNYITKILYETRFNIVPFLDSYRIDNLTCGCPLDANRNRGFQIFDCSVKLYKNIENIEEHIRKSCLGLIKQE